MTRPIVAARAGVRGCCRRIACRCARSRYQPDAKSEGIEVLHVRGPIYVLDRRRRQHHGVGRAPTARCWSTPARADMSDAVLAAIRQLQKESRQRRSAVHSGAETRSIAPDAARHAGASQADPLHRQHARASRSYRRQREDRPRRPDDHRRQRRRRHRRDTDGAACSRTKRCCSRMTKRRRPPLCRSTCRPTPISTPYFKLRHHFNGEGDPAHSHAGRPHRWRQHGLVPRLAT